MKISLIISDVDATLITPDHEITSNAMLAIEKLQCEGISFSIASSRPLRGLLGFAEQLNLTGSFAAFNGGMIQKTNGETIFKQFMSREICESAFDVAKRFGVDLWVYCDKEWHVDRITPFVERERNTIAFDPIVENDLQVVFGKAAKLVIVGDPSCVAKAEPYALDQFGDKVSATKSKPRFLDITAKEAHKGTVVKQLARSMGIPTAEIAVIGDGLNDVLMFEQAGFSIAMGQADDEVKQAANVVTKANTEEGFAYAMEEFIL